MAELVGLIVAILIIVGIPLAIILFFAVSATMIARIRNKDLIVSRVVWANIATAMGVWILYGFLAPDQYQRQTSQAGFGFWVSTEGFRLKLALGGIPHPFWWIAILFAIVATTTVIALAEDGERNDTTTGTPPKS